jgi:hypothetical protein
MKKFLAVVAVVLMLATSAFAVSITKEMAKGGLPGVLYNEANLSAAASFPSLVNDLPNLVILDYIYGNAIGSLIVKTDLGVLGISISPRPSLSIDGISFWNNVYDMAAVSYGTSLDNMKIGAALMVGMDSEATKDLDTDVSSSGDDNENETVMFLGLKGGVSIEGMDLGIGVNMLNESDVEGIDDDYEDTETNNIMDIMVAARMKLAGWNLVAGIDYVMGSAKEVEKDLTTDYDETTTYTNSQLGVQLLAGNTIKASETLSVTVGTGLLWVGSGAYKYAWEDSDGNESISGGDWSSAELGIPLWVAVEGKLNETWTVLGGTSTTLLAYEGTGYKYDDDADPAEQDLKPSYEESELNIEPELDFAVGLQGKIGDLVLDLNLNPSILLYGPNFISGQTFTMNSTVALSYMWK